MAFNVHRGLICAESKYFVTACSEPWLVDNCVSLPEDLPAIFKRLLDWLYSKSYTEDGEKRTPVTDIRAHFLLGVLADKLQVPKLTTHMGHWIDKQLTNHRTLPPVGGFRITEFEARYVYENTLLFSRLHVSLTRMIAKVISMYSKDHWQVAMKGNSEFAFDLATALMDRLDFLLGGRDNQARREPTRLHDLGGGVVVEY